MGVGERVNDSVGWWVVAVDGKKEEWRWVRRKREKIQESWLKNSSVKSLASGLTGRNGMEKPRQQGIASGVFFFLSFFPFFFSFFPPLFPPFFSPSSYPPACSVRLPNSNIHYYWPQRGLTANSPKYHSLQGKMAWDT